MSSRANVLVNVSSARDGASSFVDMGVILAQPGGEVGTSAGMRVHEM